MFFVLIIFLTKTIDDDRHERDKLNKRWAIE